MPRLVILSEVKDLNFKDGVMARNTFCGKALEILRLRFASLRMTNMVNEFVEEPN